MVVVRPEGAGPAAALRELWAYRELAAFLVWRDLTVRYRQTIIGIAWALVQPLATMLVFVIVFGRLARVPTDGVPSMIFFLSALLPWTWFSGALLAATGSVVEHQRVITRVYFPRLLLPMAAVAPGAVDLMLGVAVMLPLAAVSGLAPSWRLAALPVAAVLIAVAALGPGVWLAALNARYRDARLAVPFLLQLWLFASPVAYASSLVPERWRWAYALNPVAGPIDVFRWAVAGGPAPLASVGTGVLASLLLLATGVGYFRRVEGSLADVV